MARYAQRVGPAALFNIPVPMTVVTGMSITDYWDDGELLVMATGQVRNNGGAVSATQFAIALDGAIVTGFIHQLNIAIALFTNFSLFGLIPTSEGRHTIELQAQEGGGTNTELRDRRSILTVIQLPLWGPTTNLITF